MAAVQYLRILHDSKDYIFSRISEIIYSHSENRALLKLALKAVASAAHLITAESKYRKILKFGTPQTIAIIVQKIEKFDVTLH